jgi:hypothetical protein
MRGRLAVAAVVLLVGWLTGGGEAWSAPAPGTNCQSPNLIVNGSFEQPAFASGFRQQPPQDVSGWKTDGPTIEIWHSGFLNVPAESGQQFAEIASTVTGQRLYQTFATTPGSVLTYEFWHRGRFTFGEDTMELQIGAPGGPVQFSQRESDRAGNWRQVLGSYRVPPGQTQTQMSFVWISSAEGPGHDTGNFLDNVIATQSLCTLTVTNRLIPPDDPGRFGLLVGGQPVAAGTDGSSGPLPVSVPATSVSAPAAPGTPDDYASVTSCIDARTGAPVIEEPMAQADVTFTRPAEHVACTITHERGATLTLQKETYPAGSGQFNLFVGPKEVKAAAADGYVAGPVAGRARRVTVSEQATAGTDGGRYDSEIECFTGSGPDRRPVAMTAERSLSVPVAPGQHVTCVLLDVRPAVGDPKPPPSQPAPAPPASPGAPVVAPSSPAGGQINLRVRALPLRARVTAGAPARFRLSVTNLGSLPADDVRVVIAAGQDGVRSRSVRVSMAARSGLCQSAGGVGFCDTIAIMPGRTVTLTVTATSLGTLSPLRLVAVARASEPERIVANNLARALVRMLSPPTIPCAAAARAHGPAAHAAC